MYLSIVHLSHMEFCTAGSLCRTGVKIKEELAKLSDNERFKAVTSYMAGLFGQNSSIDFLNMCKNLCQNFLDLLENEEQEAGIRSIFRSIIERQICDGRWMKLEVEIDKESNTLAETKSITEHNDHLIMSPVSVGLLLEAMAAAGQTLVYT